VVFASEIHTKGHDDFGNIILGVELNKELLLLEKILRNAQLMLSQIWAWRTIL
jgi:hypothetical protein